jgi:hypothetical protein
MSGVLHPLYGITGRGRVPTANSKPLIWSHRAVDLDQMADAAGDYALRELVA